jgi:hypothetical protein
LLGSRGRRKVTSRYDRFISWQIYSRRRTRSQNDDSFN